MNRYNVLYMLKNASLIWAKPWIFVNPKSAPDVQLLDWPTQS